MHNQGRHGGMDADVASHIKRPYQCAYCHHTSGLSGNMTKHLRGVHANLPVKYVDLRKVANEKRNETEISNNSGSVT